MSNWTSPGLVDLSTEAGELQRDHSALDGGHDDYEALMDQTSLRLAPVCGEHIDQRPRRPHGERVRQREQVVVARDKDRAGRLGEGEQVVVAGVARVAGHVVRVERDRRRTGEQRNQRPCIGERDSLPELRVGQSAVQLGKQLLRDDELEPRGALIPSRHMLSDPTGAAW